MREYRALSKMELGKKEVGNREDLIVKGVKEILNYGIDSKASDVHIEKGRDGIKIRYRKDGFLESRWTLNLGYHSEIVSRIKILSRLNISERRQPQDGRFVYMDGDREVTVRVSTLDSLYGEKIVLRLLNKDNSLMIDDLGFSSEDIERIRRVVNYPTGMILVVGPTGSGKSTTLYSLLKELDKERYNISTVEDPIEYSLDGITQIECREKLNLTFERILRSLLRQDPDIIMIGEIRDFETAEIAFRASLTGHLVMSTLHTNNSLLTIERLREIGLENYIVASTLSLVISQRLVRKICPHCKVEDDKWESWLKVLGEERVEGEKFYKGKGCSRCESSGYNGRTVIYEILEVDDEIASIIQGNNGELEKSVEGKKMKPIIENALEKARAGIVSLEDIVRLFVR